MVKYMNTINNEVVEHSSDYSTKMQANATSGENIDKAHMRTKRGKLLSQSDWTQFADCKLSDSKKAEWVTYRQALRDLPAQSGFPDVDMPTKPS